MGCDINMFLEYSENGNLWYTYADNIHLGRNYRMFGYLTNGTVRYDVDVKNGVDPRGMPSNPSYVIQEDLDKFKDGTHNLSWLKYKEYKKILKEALKPDIDEEKVPDEYILLLKMMKFLKKRGYKVRITFFFDS